MLCLLHTLAGRLVININSGQSERNPTMPTIEQIAKVAKTFGGNKIADAQAQEIALKAIEAVKAMNVEGHEEAYQLALQVRAGCLGVRHG
jgi:hypothetical protein